VEIAKKEMKGKEKEKIKKREREKGNKRMREEKKRLRAARPKVPKQPRLRSR